jgi:hypothetical protein
VLAELPHIALDPWRSLPPMILTESRSLAGVLRHIVADYRARIASTNGQCGHFLRTNIAPVLQPGVRVIYLGDLDLAGNQIEDNTRRVLEREIAGELIWEWLALTREQVREYDLPVIIKRDRRYRDGRPHEAVETEAISRAPGSTSCCPSSSPVFLNVRHVNDAKLQRCCAGKAMRRRRIAQEKEPECVNFGLGIRRCRGSLYLSVT